MIIFNFIMCLLLATQMPEVQSMEASKWKEATDSKTGRTYYYNKLTKKSTWEKPKDLDQNQQTATPSMEASQWKEATDLKTGRTYWYHVKTKETTWKNPVGVDQSKGSSDPSTSKDTSKSVKVVNYFDTEIFLVEKKPNDSKPAKRRIRVCSGCSEVVKKPKKVTHYSVLDVATEKELDSFTVFPNQKLYVIPRRYDLEDKKVVKFVFYGANELTSLKKINFYDENNTKLKHPRFYINDIPDNSFHVPKKNETKELVIKAVVDKNAVSYTLKSTKEGERKFPTSWLVIVDDQAVAFNDDEVKFCNQKSPFFPLFELATPHDFSFGAVVKVVNHKNRLNDQFGVIVGGKEDAKCFRFEDQKAEPPSCFKIRFDDEKFGVEKIDTRNLQLLKDATPQYSFVFPTVASRNEKLISFKSILLYDGYEQLIKVRFGMNGQFGSDLTWTRGKKAWTLDAFIYGTRKVAYYEFVNGPDKGRLPISWKVFDAKEEEVDTQRLTGARMEANSHKRFYLLSGLKKSLTFEFTEPNYLSKQIKMRHLELREHVDINKEHVFVPLLIHDNERNCNRKKLEFDILDEKPYKIDVYTGPDQFVTGYNFVSSQKHENSFAPRSWNVYNAEGKRIDNKTSVSDAFTHGVYHFWKLELKFQFIYKKGNDDTMSFKDMKFYDASGEKMDVKLYMNGKLGTDLKWEKQKRVLEEKSDTHAGGHKNNNEDFEWILEVFTNGKKPIVSYQITTHGTYNRKMKTSPEIPSTWEVYDSHGNSTLGRHVLMHPGASEKFLLSEEQQFPVLGAPRLGGQQIRRPKKIKTNKGIVKAKKALRFYFDAPRSGSMFMLERIALFDKNEEELIMWHSKQRIKTATKKLYQLTSIWSFTRQLLSMSTFQQTRKSLDTHLGLTMSITTIYLRNGVWKKDTVIVLRRRMKNGMEI